VSEFRLIAIAFGGILGLSTVEVAAQAGDIAYCIGYANAAVNHSQVARAFDGCQHFIRDLPARWSLNYIDHFRACLPRFGSGRTALEEQARIADLTECIRGQ